MNRLIFLLSFTLMGSSLPTLKYRAMDNSGVPMSGAKLYFYTHGTTTPKATYSNEALSSANANPVVADSHGWFGEIYLHTNDKYKVVLKSAAGITIWTLDDIAAAQITDSSLAARMLQIASSPMDYGAVGDGVADDSVAVQAAITGASGVVDLVGKTYRVDDMLTLKSGLTIRNGTLDFTASTDDTYLSATGTVGAANLLTGNVSAGAVILPLTTVAGLAVGDLLWLTSTTTYGATGTKGEICRITSIAALNVYLAAPLADSYTTAATASVKEITAKSDIILDDLTVTANSAAAGTGILFACTYCDRVTMRGTTFTGIKTAGARFTTSTLISIQAARFASTYGIATAIGVDLLDGVNAVSITGGSSFSTLIKGVALGLDGASRVGPTRNVNISSSVFEDCTTAAIHAGIMSAHLSVAGSIIRAANPADGLHLTSVIDVRVVGTTFVGGDYGIDDTTVTSLLTASNYFTGQTTGSIKGSAAAVVIAVGAGAQDAFSGTGGAASGDGGTFTGGAPNGRGVVAQGDGTGVGVSATGGDTAGAAGVSGTGGSAGGNGVLGTGVAGGGYGYGVLGVGATSYDGVRGEGTGSGEGVSGKGGATGYGGAFTGGDTSNAAGVYGLGGTTNGDGGSFAASGAGDGVDASSETGSAVKGTAATTGAGGMFTSAAGYGTVVQGDTTSPTFGAFRIVPQDTAPTRCSIGDLYVTAAGVLYVATTAGVSPCGAWTKVGAQ